MGLGLGVLLVLGGLVALTGLVGGDAAPTAGAVVVGAGLLVVAVALLLHRRRPRGRHPRNEG